MKKQWSTVFVILLMLIVVVFAVLNVDPVLINFGFTSVSIPLVIVIIGTLLIGVLIAVIWSTSLVLQERNQRKKLQSQFNELKAAQDAEINQIREKHQQELASLKEVKEGKEAEIRELTRRVHNMQTSQSLKADHQNDV